MTDKRITAPPAQLLRTAAGPEARTIVAELRTDASIEFDPQAGPASLLVNESFGGLIVWRVDLSWSLAQEVQLWLIGAPAGPAFATREEALKDFFDNIVDGNGDLFLTYIGTYLEAGLSHASYTMTIGMFSPVSREDYQQIFLDALDALPPAWRAEVVDLIRLLCNQPSSREEYLLLASNEGDLARSVAGKPVHPLIHAMIT